MQSPWAIVLRTCMLLGALGILPLCAAGGLDAPGEVYSMASAWLTSHLRTRPLIAPHTIQVELPTEALCYRDPFAAGNQTKERASEVEPSGITPVNYEEILSPADRDLTSEADSSQAAHWASLAPASLSPASPVSVNAYEQAPASQMLPTPVASTAWTENTTLVARPTVSEVEGQLRELGVIDVRLEPWGGRGQFYRYCAVVSVAGSADVQRHFQSIAADPGAASLDVLAQVKAWCLP